jgi:hypothetical protein
MHAARAIAITRGRLLAADVDQALQRVVVALSAEVREVATTPPTGSTGWGSLNDFHLLVRLDSVDNRLERRFVGYEGSLAQSFYLPLELAVGALKPLIERVPSTEYLDIEEARRALGDEAWFERRFRDSAAHFDDPYMWRVRDLYVGASEWLGSRAVVPDLLRLFDLPRDRTRDAALSAVEHIIGWRPRRPDGEALSADEARDQVRVECERGMRAR